jgi:hypothetical protein
VHSATYLPSSPCSMMMWNSIAFLSKSVPSLLAQDQQSCTHDKFQSHGGRQCALVCAGGQAGRVLVGTEIRGSLPSELQAI